MKLFLFILLYLCFINVFAQPSSCDSTIRNCAVDASKLNFGIDSLYGPTVVKYGKASAPNYYDVQYVLNCGGGALNYCRTDKDSALQIIVYYPKNRRNCKYPIYFYMHAGSYSDCGPVGMFPQAKEICRDMARKGFIACDIDYRRGVLVDTTIVAGSNPPVTYLTAQQTVAIYKALQDVEGAIRFIIFSARSQSSSSLFQMDTTQLYIGGFSAGSVLALPATYYQSQAMLDSIFPGIKTVLGNIKQTFYKGDTSINYFPYILGINSCWGDLLVPYSFRNNPALFFSHNTNNPPIILWHGKFDSTFYPTHQDYYFDPHTNFHGFNPKSDTTCLNGGVYTLSPNPNHPDLRGLGSEDIYDVFTSHGIAAQLHLDCQSGHGLDSDCVAGGDTACKFQSDWGTGYHHVDSVIEYIAEQNVGWFQVNYADSAQYLTTTRFIECENFRTGCRTADTSNGCQNSDVCPNNLDNSDQEQFKLNNHNSKTIHDESFYNSSLLPANKRSINRAARKP